MAVSLFQVNVFAAGYTDTSGHWAEEFINKWSLGDKPILEGYGDAKFAPDDAMKSGDLDIIIAKVLGKAMPEWADSPVINREEAMKKIAVAFGVAPLTDISDPDRFEDDERIAEDCAGYVYALKELGAVAGRGGNMFAPKEAYTRAEALSVVYHMIAAVADKDADLTEDSYDSAVVVRASGVTVADKTFDGDLIIGQGVGDGEVILENTAVNGRLIVFGGGANSIVLRNSTVNEVDGFKNMGQTANVKVEGDSTVGFVNIAASGKLTVTGSVDRIVVEAGAELTLLGDAAVREIVIAGAGANIGIAGNAKVEGLTVATEATGTALSIAGGALVSALTTEAANTTVTVAAGAEVLAVIVAAEGAAISGAGSVDAITVTAAVTGRTVVGTNGTAVQNNSTANVVNNAGTTVTGPGASSTTSTSNSSSGGSSGGGGGSSSGGGTTTPTPGGVIVPSVSPQIEIPVAGARPSPRVEWNEYDASIVWDGAPEVFAANTSYKATVTLTAKAGYRFTSATKVTVFPAAVTPVVTQVQDYKLVFAVTYPPTAATEPTGEQWEAYGEYELLRDTVYEWDYTAESWAAYQTAMASNFLITASNTVEEIEAAITAITEAQNNILVATGAIFKWPNADHLYVNAAADGTVTTAVGVGTLTPNSDNISVKQGPFTADVEYIVEDLDQTGVTVKVTGNKEANTVTVEVSGIAANSGATRIVMQDAAFEGADARNTARYFAINVTKEGDDYSQVFAWDDGETLSVSASSDGTVVPATKVGRFDEKGLWDIFVKNGLFTADLEYIVSDPSATGVTVTLTGNETEGAITVTVNGTAENSGTVTVDPTTRAFIGEDAADLANTITIEVTKAAEGEYTVNTPSLLRNEPETTSNTALEIVIEDMDTLYSEGDTVEFTVRCVGDIYFAGRYDIEVAYGGYVSGGYVDVPLMNNANYAKLLSFVMPPNNIDDLKITCTFIPE